MSTTTSVPDSHGLVLLGHGARDPRWAEPFERLASLTRAMRSAQAQADAPVALAYLELMPPGLPEVIAAQAAAGCVRITVVPVFFGQGAHLRRDLPVLLSSCQAAHPAVDIRLAAAVGEDETVLRAIASFCVRAGDA